MANTSNAVNWDAIELGDLSPAKPASESTAQPAAPATINWDALALDDLTPEGAVDYGNGATGVKGTGSEYSGEAQVYTAGKRDRGEDMSTYEQLNSGRGGEYSPMTHGMSFGSFDELSSAGLAPVQAAFNAASGDGPTSIFEAYDQEKARYLRDKALYEEQYPKTALAGEIAGGLLTGGVGAKTVTAMPTLGQKLITGAGVGALETGLYSGLNAEGTLADRLQAAGEGARIGAVAGAAGPVAERVVPAVARTVRNTAAGTRDAVADVIGNARDGMRMRSNPEAFAEDFFARNAAKDVASFIDEERAAVATGRAAPQRNFMNINDANSAFYASQRPSVGDLGGNRAREAVRATVGDEPDLVDIITRQRDSRVQQQGERTAQVVDSLFGGSGTDPIELLNGLRDAARRENEKAYRAAFGHDAAQHIWNNNLRRVTGSDAMQQAMADAARDFGEDAVAAGGRRVAPEFARNADDGLLDFVAADRGGGASLATRGDPNLRRTGASLEFWDTVKKNLDDQIEAAKEGGRWTNKAERIRKLRDSLVGELDAATVAGDGESLYRRARGTAKVFFDARDSYEAGAEFFKRQGAMASSEARAAVERMGPADREMFARAYAAEFINKISQQPDGSKVSRLLNNADAREKLEIAVGKARADVMQAHIAREGVQRALGDMIARRGESAGSALMNKQLANIVGSGVGYGLTAMQSGSLSDPVNLIGVLAGAAGGQVFRRMNAAKKERFARALAELVTAEDQATVQRVYNKIMSDKQVAEAANNVSGYGLTTRSGGNAPPLFRSPAFNTRAADATIAATPALTSRLFEGSKWSEEASGDRLSDGPADGEEKQTPTFGFGGPMPAYRDGGLVRAHAAIERGERDEERENSMPMLSPEDIELVTTRARRNGNTPEEEMRRLMHARSGTALHYRGLPSERRERQRAGGAAAFAEGGRVDVAANREQQGYAEGGRVSLGENLYSGGDGYRGGDVPEIGALSGEQTEAFKALMEHLAALSGPNLVGAGERFASPGGPGPRIIVPPVARAPRQIDSGAPPKKYAKGGSVSAEPHSTHKGGGGEPDVRGLQAGHSEPVAGKGRSGGGDGAPSFDDTSKPRAMGKTAHMPASSRRGGADRSRDRSRPERMRNPTDVAAEKAAMRKSFWGGLRAAAESHAAERGFVWPTEMFSHMDEQPVALEMMPVEPMMPPEMGGGPLEAAMAPEPPPELLQALGARAAGHGSALEPTTPEEAAAVAVVEAVKPAKRKTGRKKG